jgi:hypothetical protein
MGWSLVRDQACVGEGVPFSFSWVLGEEREGLGETQLDGDDGLICSRLAGLVVRAL